LKHCCSRLCCFAYQSVVDCLLVWLHLFSSIICHNTWKLCGLLLKLKLTAEPLYVRFAQ
jgi:hypothetical protein